MSSDTAAFILSVCALSMQIPQPIQQLPATLYLLPLHVTFFFFIFVFKTSFSEENFMA